MFRTFEKEMQNDILRSVNSLKRWYLTTKKTFFSKIESPKMTKICYFKLYDQTTLWVPKGTEYINSISYSVKVWGQLKIEKFGIFMSSWGFETFL